MSEGAECKYYKPTARGYRCVFIGVQEWRTLSGKYLQYCKAGGSGCPVLASVMKKIPANRNTRLKGVESGLFKAD